MPPAIEIGNAPTRQKILPVSGTKIIPVAYNSPHYGQLLPPSRMTITLEEAVRQP
jgi:hypothetical protein